MQRCASFLPNLDSQHPAWILHVLRPTLNIWCSLWIKLATSNKHKLMVWEWKTVSFLCICSVFHLPLLFYLLRCSHRPTSSFMKQVLSKHSGITVRDISQVLSQPIIVMCGFMSYFFLKAANSSRRQKIKLNEDGPHYFFSVDLNSHSKVWSKPQSFTANFRDKICLL